LIFIHLFLGIKEVQEFILDNFVAPPCSLKVAALARDIRELETKLFFDNFEPLFFALVSLQVTMTKFKIAVLPNALKVADDFEWDDEEYNAYFRKCDILLRKIDAESASLKWPVFGNSSPFNAYQYYATLPTEDGGLFYSKMKVLVASQSNLV
jgi:hypothetical protein